MARLAVCRVAVANRGQHAGPPLGGGGKAGGETGEPPPEVAEPDADLERRAMLFQLVERLPDVQRRVIELRYIEERSLVEVAQELGQTEGAVKQLQRPAVEN